MKQWITGRDFQLESGEKLDDLILGYQSFGKLNAEKDNVVWICHALTGDTDPTNWWESIVGRGKVIDTDKYFVVCANNLASPFGSTNALSFNSSKERYYRTFPELTTRDIARAFDELRIHLQIPKIQYLIGISFGGQIALEWNVFQSGIFKHSIFIATNARHSPHGIAFNESQRLAIESDGSFYRKNLLGGKTGLIAARSIALLSYRTPKLYNVTQKENSIHTNLSFKAASYQQYQGVKFALRFDAFNYYALTKIMDKHNVGRNRGGVQRALEIIQNPCLVVGVNSDGLFPLEEQEYLAEYIGKAQLGVLKSIYGHDGFLMETEQLAHLLDDYINNDFNKNKITKFKKVAV